MRSSILGIDPGVSGALALFAPNLSAASGARWQVIDMPVIGERAELNASALRDWLRRMEPEHAYLEFVAAMPSIPDANGKRRGMGVTSAFRFGGMFFAIKAVLACCDVPFSLVTPQSWKKSASLMKSDKEASRLRALQLFPDQAAALARKKDQNRAEAMLIARYGAIVMGERKAA